MTATTPVVTAPEAEADPIRVPTDLHVACCGCGVPVHRPTRPVVGAIFEVDAYVRESEPITRTQPITTSLGRCPTCTGIADRAAQLCVDHPEIGRRLGDQAGRWRVEVCLSALAAIGVTPSAELLHSSYRALLRHLSPSAGSVRWQMRCAPTVLAGGGPGWCAPSPWACAPPAALAAVREGWAAALRERVAASRSPVAVPCPVGGGCALCGVSVVLVPAVQALRDRADGRSVWTPTTVTVGAKTTKASLCPACAAAVAAVGSVGPTAAERAAIAWLQSVGRDDDATTLRGALTGSEPPAIRPFGRGRGSSRPWQHVRLPG